MSKYGIQFNSASTEKSDLAIPQTILVRINDLKIQRYEVIIYILNQIDDDIYHGIQFVGNVKLVKSFYEWLHMKFNFIDFHLQIILFEIEHHQQEYIKFLFQF